MKNSIDLRKELDEMLTDYGYHVLLQRTRRQIHCRCWNSKHQEADSRCPICLGTGWVTRIERHQVFYQNQSQITSKPNLTRVGAIGNVYTPANLYFMKHFTHPQIGDYIYEVGWKGQRPVNLIRCNEITHVEPKRGDNGRIEYYLVCTKADTLDVEFKNFVVRSIGPIQNYEILR